MNSSGGDRDEREDQQGDQFAPRDLIDFYQRWDEFRQTAVDMANRPDLSTLERLTVHWMVLLIDRIGERDLT
jgi:hypothetical protein